MKATTSFVPGHWLSRLAGSLTLTVAVSLVGGSGAGAEQLTRPDGTWNVIAEARGVSPYAETPSEQSGGGPFVRAELESSNQTVPAFAFGALGYPSYEAQEGAIGVKEKPGDVYASSSSDSKYTKSARFAPFGDAGPFVAAEAPDDLTAHADGAFRFSDSPACKADGGFSDARSSYSQELQAMVAEATTHVIGLSVDKIHIANFESWVRVVFPRDAEPTVDYRLAMTGISSDKTETAGWATRSSSSGANKDLVISGQGVGIGQFAESFSNQQANIPSVLKGRITIDKPRVSKSGQYYRVAGAAIEARWDNTPRERQFGQVMALRIGDSEVAGYFQRIGED